MKKILGIEFGSTRIKAVLTDEKGTVSAIGTYDWENILVEGLWSYKLEDAVFGMQECYKALKKDFYKKTSENLTELDALGISGMMHGYLAFDEEYNLLAPFRTWRNTNAEEASKVLTESFRFHMPMRWSVSQFYQSILDGLSHVTQVKHLHTLASYFHHLLTDTNVVGINDASGMFPILNCEYDSEKAEIFNKLAREKGISEDIRDLLPKPLCAGTDAGKLTETGAKLLDPTGELKAGCIMCPPEGDMGTGTICTNTVTPGTANISAGTSGNLSVVMSKPLQKYYYEIDIQNTPVGDPVALIHTNNCCSEIRAWINVFDEVLKLFGTEVPRDELYNKLFNKALESDMDVGKMSEYNFLAAEPIAGVHEGRPSLVRDPAGKMNLANIMQSNVYSALAAISLGTGILKEEGVEIKEVKAHGGYYKTPFVGQNVTSALMDAPVCVMDNAGEGGAYGIAVLALYTYEKCMENCTINLSKFLDELYGEENATVLEADEKEKQKFANYMENYKKGLRG